MCVSDLLLIGSDKEKPLRQRRELLLRYTTYNNSNLTEEKYTALEASHPVVHLYSGLPAKEHEVR